MFSLIITIISIALVAALALATLYYGGSSFNRGAAGAEAARLINEGQQVNGAVALYNSDVQSGGAVRTDLAGLVTGQYLSQVPGSFAGSTTLSAKVAAATNTISAETCFEVEKRAGAVAAGDTVDTHTFEETLPDDRVFGCYGANKTSLNFGYRF